ncbi:MAG: pilus assembly protein [Acidobacteria bacterium]|nr:pilus assembly protein [Acidobacteriota bacterium]
MKKQNGGGAAFEYIIIIAIIAVVAVAGSYYYRSHVVEKGFEQSIQSIDQGQDLASGELISETGKASKLKLTGPMMLGIFCIVILMIILFSTFKAARKAKRGLKDVGVDEDGQAMTEFIISFPILLFITLCMMQLSLIYTARLVVNYSAFSAVRAAAVIIPISLDKQDSNDKNEPEGLVIYKNKKGKLNMIRNAARLTCMPISADASSIMNEFVVTVAGHSYKPLQWAGTGLSAITGAVGAVFNAIGGVFGSDDLGNYVDTAIDRYIYSYFFTNIELLDDNFSPIKEDKTYGRKVVTVRVIHAFHLGIPIANAFMGKRFGWSLFEKLGLNKLDDLFGTNLNQYETGISAGYVFPLKAECTMHVEMKAE